MFAINISLWLSARVLVFVMYPDNKVHGAHLGPVGPIWAPCWPHEPCYQGTSFSHAVTVVRRMLIINNNKSAMFESSDNSVPKNRKIFYRPDVQVIFVLYSYLRCLRSFIPNKTIFTKYCFTQWISKLPKSFGIHWVRQYLVHFMVLAGIVNETVYKTELIFTGLGHGKFSEFLALTTCWNLNTVDLNTMSVVNN